MKCDGDSSPLIPENYLGYEVVLVLIVELERVAELGGSAIFGAGAAKGGELIQGNEAVMVGVSI